MSNSRDDSEIQRAPDMSMNNVPSNEQDVALYRDAKDKEVHLQYSRIPCTSQHSIYCPSFGSPYGSLDRRNTDPHPTTQPASGRLLRCPPVLTTGPRSPHSCTRPVGHDCALKVSPAAHFCRASSSSTSARLSTFPTMVLGKSSRNSTKRGTL